MGSFTVRRAIRPVLILSSVTILILVMTAEAGFIVNGFGVYTGLMDQKDARIVQDGSGGAIIVWEDSDNGYTIAAQRVDSEGRPQWGDEGIVVCDETGGQHDPLAVPDGSGGAIVVWNDTRNGKQDIFGQRIDAGGVALWASGGVSVVAKTGDQYLEHIIPEAGGAIVVYTEWSDGMSDIKVEAQRLDGAGSLLWGASGISVSNAAGHQEEPCLAPNGSGGAIIAWQDSRGEFDIYAQSVSAAGMVLWDAGGAAVCAEAEGQYDPVIVSDGSGGAIVSWTDYRRGDFRCDIYAQRVDGSGGGLWTTNGVAVCTAADDQFCESIAGDGSGGAIIAWVDYRSGVEDVYAQRMNAVGGGLWTYNGKAVCTAAGNQWHVRTIADGTGGAIIGWVDWRSQVPSDYNIYAQRIDGSGLARWTSGGVGICTESDDQSDAELTGDGFGGAFIVWEDRRSGDYDIYASRVDMDGEPVATFLASYSIDLEGAWPRLTWTLMEEPGDRDFRVSRSTDGSATFQQIPDADITIDGRTCRFFDTDCVPGTYCVYRVEMIDDGEPVILLEAGPVHVPGARFVLHQNHPNPFNPSTTIEYVLPSPCRVRLSVYDPAGRMVARLVDAEQPAGPYAVVWNGLDAAGRQLPSGIYFYSLRAGKMSTTRKMILLR